MPNLEANRIAKAERLTKAILDYTEVRTPAEGAAVVANLRGWTNGGWALLARACGEGAPSEQTQRLVVEAVQRRVDPADPFAGLA